MWAEPNTPRAVTLRYLLTLAEKVVEMAERFCTKILSVLRTLSPIIPNYVAHIYLIVYSKKAKITAKRTACWT